MREFSCLSAGNAVIYVWLVERYGGRKRDFSDSISEYCGTVVNKYCLIWKQLSTIISWQASFI